MLVLNTNQGGGGAYTLSNKNIVPMYPECDDHILIYPELTRYNKRQATDNVWTAFEVNWTPVHALSWVYEAPHNIHWYVPNYGYTWNSSSSWVLMPFCGSISLWANIPLLFRVWIETPLQAWLVIWKQIIFPVLYAYWSNYTPTNSLDIKVWLLHSDWTINYIATNSYWTPTSITHRFNTNNGWRVVNNGGYSSSWKYWWSNTVITWSWMTTVEWDRIIVEYILWSGSYDMYFIIWTITPTDIKERIYPIQISID